MKRLRFWIAVNLLWLCVFYNIERLQDETFNLASFVYLLAAAFIVGLVYLRRLRLVPTEILVTVALTSYLLGKVSLGYQLFGAKSPLTVMELTALAISIGLARRLASCIEHFEEAAQESVIRHLQDRSVRFDIAESDFYREVRRSRQHKRQLALLAIQAEPQSVHLARNALIEEIQRTSVQSYVQARVADLLSRETADCDLVAQADDRFFVLIPEADREAAEMVRNRIRQAASDSLGFDVQIGIATFPDPDVTLAGMLEQATEQMFHFADKPSDDRTRTSRHDSSSRLDRLVRAGDAKGRTDA